MTWIVSGPLAVVKVGGKSRRLDRGTAVPEGATNIEHLLGVGLIAEVKPEPAEVEPEPVKAPVKSRAKS